MMKPNNSDIEKLRAKIWITSKARICSEARFRRYDLYSHLGTIYFSLCLILASIKMLGADVEPRADLFVILSISLLVLSVVLWGFRFSHSADRHRECYLRLQRLYSQSDALDDLAAKYHDALLAYPNHSSFDYRTFVVTEKFSKGSKLSDSEGTEIKASFGLVASYAFWMLIEIVVVLAVISFPPLVYMFL